MSGRVLLTGVGTVGREVLLGILRRTSRDVLVVVRDRGRRRAPDRATALFDEIGLSADERRRVTVLCGDVTSPGFGLGPAALDGVIGSAEVIVHTAATTSLTADRELCDRVNRGGTAHALMIAERAFGAGVLTRFVHVSTAMVAGSLSDGRILEDELPIAPAHGNYYESSKYDAERIVRAAMGAGLPAAILRPSMVVGDSRTGRTRDFDVIYPLMRILASGYVTRFPAEPAAPVHLAPLDMVVEGTLAAMETPWANGLTFHLTAPQPPTVAQLFGSDAFFPEGAARPQLCSPDDFDLASCPARERDLLESVAFCFPYFCSRLTFDTSNVKRLIPLPVTDEAFLSRLGRFAIDSGYIRTAVA